jgi:hypothetical protein
MLAFNEVVGLLEDAGFIGGVQRQGGKIRAFTENVRFYGSPGISVGGFVRWWSGIACQGGDRGHPGRVDEMGTRRPRLRSGAV